MRLSTPSSPCLLAAAALLAGSASVPAVAHPHAGPPAPLPACTAPEDHTFPLTTRIHGGPARYEPGGGYGTWYLDLHNTTDRTCSGVHPVVVLVDEERALRPGQPRLEFYADDRPHAVRFEETDADELVGAFTGEGDDFPGFTVGPGRTVTVKVRLALTSDAVPNEVTANAAVVQRRAGDGDWVGQSNDYRFRIAADETSADPGADADTGPDADPSTGPGTDPGADPGTAASPAPTGDLDVADELAGTGLGRTYAALAATALLLAAGTGAVVLGRRGRR
ncbi:hypothetical protein ACLGIH_21675 [Streptomyces sp. HMX87]|uniref:hypothetical protein n=1 Tax=Streptomyces sp. HMX87 TaxID=3390849 RepID=UPI003A84D87F